jgi:hypothetical protein
LTTLARWQSLWIESLKVLSVAKIIRNLILLRAARSIDGVKALLYGLSIAQVIFRLVHI